MDGYVQQHIASYRCRFNGTRRGALIARDNSIRWGGWGFYFDLPQSVSLRGTAEPDVMGTRLKSQMETPGADGEFVRVGHETKHTRWSGDGIQPTNLPRPMCPDPEEFFRSRSGLGCDLLRVRR